MSVLNTSLSNGNVSFTTNNSANSNGTLSNQSKKGVAVVQLDPKVRAQIIANLRNFGLRLREFEQIEQFYGNNQQQLNLFKEPVHIKGKSLTPPLSRSLVYLPNGSKKGLYILLKDRGGIKEIGLGSYSRATLAVQMETGEKSLFRSAKKEHIRPKELEANKITSNRQKYFASGIPVKYTDSWRERKGRGLNIFKDYLPKEKNIKKIGFIMEFLEGGELWDRLQKKPSLTMKERIKISYKYVKALAVLHDELKLVHFDIKPNNIFLTTKGAPKIGDFGFTVKTGEIKVPQGTPGYIAPELITNTINDTDYVANPAADVWSLGCLLADVLRDQSWFNWNGQGNGDWHKLISASKQDLKDAKKSFFPRWDDVNNPDHLIYECLKIDPLKRPSASEVAAKLKNIYKGIPN